MKGKVGTIAVAAIVTAIVMQAEHESPGAVARGAGQGRQIVTPVVSETVGALGDAVIIARAEAERQGINPGAVFATPTTAAGGGLPDVDPNKVGN